MRTAAFLVPEGSAQPPWMQTPPRRPPPLTDAPRQTLSPDADHLDADPPVDPPHVGRQTPVKQFLAPIFVCGR